MDGKLILGFLNYMTISIVFILGLTSLLLSSQKKKLTYLFLLFLAAGLVSFLFFAGLAFIFPSISIIGFCTILNLFIQNQEFFSPGKSRKDYQFQAGQALKKYIIFINLAISLFIAGGSGFIFYIYNNDFFNNISTVAVFNTATLPGIINDIGQNYIPLIFMFVMVLFMSVVWFIAILKKESKKN